jgi:hypothetical protein
MDNFPRIRRKHRRRHRSPWKRVIRTAVVVILCALAAVLLGALMPMCSERRSAPAPEARVVIDTRTGNPPWLPPDDPTPEDMGDHGGDRPYTRGM